MEQLTLQQLFGVNSSQDGQSLVIHKSDLPGLTPSGNNTAESLLTAIILKNLENFQGTITDEFNNRITDEFNNLITYENQGLYEFINSFRWEDKVVERDSDLVIRSTIVLEGFQYAD